MLDWKSYAQITTALFVIADPIAAVPMFISLTAEWEEEYRRRTARTTAITVAIVLVSSIFIGQPLLRVFGVSIASFRVGGGILILLMAISMLQARPSATQRTPEEVQEAEEKEDVAVVPLGVPLLAGPGAISTVIIYAHQARDWFDVAFLVFSGFFVALTVFIAFRFADQIRRLLGKTGINIFTRLFGLILTAVAVEFIANGLAQLLPGLASVR